MTDLTKIHLELFGFVLKFLGLVIIVTAINNLPIDAKIEVAEQM